MIRVAVPFNVASGFARELATYNKTYVERPLKNRQNKDVLKTNFLPF